MAKALVNGKVTRRADQAQVRVLGVIHFSELPYLISYKGLPGLREDYDVLGRLVHYPKDGKRADSDKAEKEKPLCDVYGKPIGYYVYIPLLKKFADEIKKLHEFDKQLMAMEDIGTH